MTPDKKGKTPRCKYPQNAKKCGMKWDREVTWQTRCIDCPSVKMRISEQLILSHLNTMSAQVTPGPLGMPIGLNYQTVDIYLQNVGYRSPWTRNWIFEKISFIFAKQMEMQMQKNKG